MGKCIGGWVLSGILCFGLLICSKARAEPYVAFGPDVKLGPEIKRIDNKGQVIFNDPSISPFRIPNDSGMKILFVDILKISRVPFLLVYVVYPEIDDTHDFFLAKPRMDPKGKPTGEWLYSRLTTPGMFYSDLENPKPVGVERIFYGRCLESEQLVILTHSNGFKRNPELEKDFGAALVIPNGKFPALADVVKRVQSGVCKEVPGQKIYPAP